jgi:predicted DCC family thiol-disulfide oxidoreductase YuxK
MPPPIVLYDGFCGLCNRLVRFVLNHDREGVFHFASLQSGLAASILASHGASPTALDTVYIVLNHTQPEESLRARSDAVVFLLQRLGGIWRIAACVLGLIPRPLRDRAYGAIARNRYRIFGRYDTCPLPNEGTRSRFLDL